MSIKKVSKVAFLGVVVSFFMSGCATTQHDEEMQRAVLILAKKVERLEKLHGIKQTRHTASGSKGKGGYTKATVKKHGVTGMKVTVYEQPKKHSKILEEIPAGEKLTIVKCDKYGWCTTKEKAGYIQSWKLKR